MSFLKNTLLLFILLGYTLVNVDAQQTDKKQLNNIIPKPLQTEMRAGEFIVNGETKIVVCNSDERIIKIANDFAAKINKAKHFKIKVIERNSQELRKNEILFCLSDDEKKYGNEGYSLDVSPKGIIIEAHQSNGIFYAVQTIYQLLPYQIFADDSVGSVSLTVPSVYIFDKPRFGWRGEMLDVSRHYISMDYLKQNLDYLASLKLNIFHWHLTDDQGWRIEIKTFPKLTEIGAWRVDRNNLHWHDRMEQQENENATYGGYYTQKEINEIIQYAKDRYIEIIPEIDIPGHSRAALAAYPEISCDEANYTVATGGIMSENTYCPGKEVTFDFTEKMLGEVMDLFPSKYVHIGGDECSKESWKVCDDCQKRIKDNNLSDEHELQSYFIKRVEKMINAKGKTMIGWDEILEGGLAPNATVMSWRGTSGGITAVKAGHDVVMSPNSHCYLDLRQGDIDMEPDYGYGKLLLSTTYSYNPVPKGFSTEEANHILGVQGNLWGESMQRPYDHNYMLFPRLFAIAEVGWTPQEGKNYDDFIRRTEYAFNRLDEMHVNYAPSMYNVSVKHEGSVVSTDLFLSLSTDVNNVEIRYTLDGSIPTLNSTIFTAAFPVNQSTTIKAQVYKNERAVGRITTKTIDIHKAAAKKVTYNIKPSNKYNTSKLCLTDCLRGTTEHSKEFWTAFRDSDMDLIIDLGEPTEISNITASFLHSTRSWIFLPINVVFEISVNGKGYIEVGNIDYSDLANEPGKYLKECKVEIEKQKIRYIRIKAKSMRINPDWHSAKGGKNWMFIDEVVVE